MAKRTRERGRGAPYVAAAGLALGLWAVAVLWVARAGCAPPDETGRGQGAATARLDVNSAGEEALRALPGVGAALSRRIVDSRRERGPFAGVEDLARVRGFTPELAERVAPFVTFGTPGPPWPAEGRPGREDGEAEAPGRGRADGREDAGP